ncbi:MAG: hypothetical protein V2A58_13045 [Planctomycetota bacterium]
MRRCLFLISVFVFSHVASASISTATAVIGGPGSISSDGSADPGLLSDGTLPGAHVVLSYDNASAFLTLDIMNDGPSGALTGLWLNVPDSVTGAAFALQGTTYRFLLFSIDNLKADGFGRFDIYVGNSSKTSGGGDPDSILVGFSETVSLALSGVGLSSLTAQSFLHEISVVPPGEHRVLMAGRFKAGTSGGGAWISNNTAVPVPAPGALLLSAFSTALAGITSVLRRKTR